MRSLLLRILREPLFAFAVSAAPCSCATPRLQSRESEPVVLPAPVRAGLIAGFEARSGRKATADDIARIERDYLTEELLLREALENGLHLSDPSVRARLVEEMRTADHGPAAGPDRRAAGQPLLGQPRPLPVRADRHLPPGVLRRAPRRSGGNPGAAAVGPAGCRPAVPARPRIPALRPQHAARHVRPADRRGLVGRSAGTMDRAAGIARTAGITCKPASDCRRFCCPSTPCASRSRATTWPRRSTPRSSGTSTACASATSCSIER